MEQLPHCARVRVWPVTQLQGRPLRTDMRERRRALNAATRMAAAEHLAAHLLSLSLMPPYGYVSGYWAVDGEIALHAWQVRLPSTITYCLPVLHDDGMLRFAPWTAGATLTSNRHGIPEPDVAESALLSAEQMDAVVAPLLAFDAHGQRLGMGGGWYDRSFAFNRTSGSRVPLIGVGYAFQQVDALDAEPWDVPVDAVCTENRSFLIKRPVPA